ncbi:hypothetical protein [Micromonospora coxensis]|uniref:Uncharacterized protein n=1 Tax=Micromonospora coxensis TaxID=356852 RepID=A0A1C5HT56_9ACTN|nr:hypothetical protein [Micromonospora coxensis]SCG49073.1 hypothetical protein GA0070614_1738 [Micromonospora coxensis]
MRWQVASLGLVTTGAGLAGIVLGVVGLALGRVEMVGFLVLGVFALLLVVGLARDARRARGRRPARHDVGGYSGYGVADPGAASSDPRCSDDGSERSGGGWGWGDSGGGSWGDSGGGSGGGSDGGGGSC